MLGTVLGTAGDKDFIGAVTAFRGSNSKKETGMYPNNLNISQTILSAVTKGLGKCNRDIKQRY